MNTERICAVISELLPLYSEGMLGEEAKAFVEEHISGCSKCSQELADFSRKTMLPITTNESNAYKAAKKRRNTLIIIISVIHDFTVEAIGFAKGEIPYTGLYAFPADKSLREAA